MTPVLVASLVMLVAFGCMESKLLETSVEPKLNSTKLFPLHTSTGIHGSGKQHVHLIVEKPALNNELASKIETFSSILKHKGAEIGNAIRKPLLAPPVTKTVSVEVPGYLIAIPLALKGGVRYVAVEAKELMEKNQALLEAKLARIRADLLTSITTLKKKTIKVGKILLKPVIIVGAAKGAIVGSGLRKVGSKLELVGDKVSGIGSTLHTAGDVLKAKSKIQLLKSIPKVQVVKTIPSKQAIAVPVEVIVHEHLSHEQNHVAPVVAVGGAGSASTIDETVIKARRNTDGEHVEFKDLLKIVDSLNLKDCVLRVICELNCDPDLYGKNGLTVYNALVRFEVSGHAKGVDSLIYRESAMKGRNLRKPPKVCAKCLDIYPQCNATSNDLIRIASRIQFH